ncbi:MAG: O-antigen ligase family protein [Calditrichaeota bacterium]|nr:O-antigen ligase family protein [Calditrichota bacterium]MCB9368373.1 O-antigen ligase family protein [Calditrichota bacterium]
MVADSAAITGKKFLRLDWTTGLAIGLISIVAVFAWFFWGRAFQFVVALSVATFGLLYLRYLEIPILVLGFLLTSNIANYIPGSTSVFMILTLMVLILRKLLVGDLKWRFGPLIIASLIFIAYYQSTGLWVDRTEYFSWELIYRVVPVLIVVSELFSTPRHHVWFFVGIAFGMLFTSLSTIRTAFEFYTTGAADQIAGSVGYIESTRFYGHWPDPNIMSMTLAAYLGGVIAFWRSKLHFLIRALMLATLVTTVAAILMSLSRTGLVGVVIVVAMMLAVERRRLLLVGILFVVTVILLTILPVDLFGRVADLLSGTDKSTSQRLSLLTAGWHMFWENPIFGGGLGHYKSNVFYYLIYLGQSLFAHNTLVDLGVDGGLVAIVLFAVCVAIALRGLDWKIKYVDNSDTVSLLNAGLRAGMVATIFSFLTMTAYSFVPFWVLMTMSAFYPAATRNQASTQLQAV